MNPSFNFQPYQLSNGNMNAMNNNYEYMMNSSNTQMYTQMHSQMQVRMQGPRPMPMPMQPQSMAMPMPSMAMSGPSMPMNPAFSFPSGGNPQSGTATPIDNSSRLTSSRQVNVVPNDASAGSTGSSVPAFIAERKRLGADFVPGPYDVICARGAAAANHPGNLRFRKTIKEIAPEYSTATTKLEKSLLVTTIVDSVRDHTPDGGFVKQFADGFWYEVGDAACREKIGQTLRDQLHTIYKSSTKAKKPRRKELKEMKKKKVQPSKKPRAAKAKAASPKVVKLPQAETEPMPSLLSSLPMDNSHQEHQQHQEEDDNEVSLTNIFYNAFVDEGLNLDTVLRG